MSIDEYKRYKEGELNLLKIKMNNVGIDFNKTKCWIIENKSLLLNVAFLSLFILPMPETLDIIVDNISMLMDEAYKTQNPKEYIDLFFKFCWSQQMPV